MVIDEAHLISHWGRSFRTAFARIGILRRYFGEHVPWFACSATLGSHILKDVKEKAAFDKEVTLLRTSIDRPEIALRLGFIQRNQKKGAYTLRFLLEDASRQGSTQSLLHRLPKTIIFYDSKKTVYCDRDQVRKWPQLSPVHKYTEAQSKEAIVAFHRDLAEDDKERIISKFSNADSRIRLLLATEAIGIGVDILDVRRVVLNVLPMEYDPAIPWQRVGRVGRDGKSSEMIILLEEWVKGPKQANHPIQRYQEAHSNVVINDKDGDGDSNVDDDSDIQMRAAPCSNAKAPGKTFLAEMERRSKLPDFWYSLANESRCLRELFLDQFDEPQQFRTNTERGRCCSNCNPNELGLHTIHAHHLHQERALKSTAGEKRIMQHLMTWCKSRLPDVWPDPAFAPTTDLFLPKHQIMRVIRDYTAAASYQEVFRRIFGPWDWEEEYGDDLWAEFNSAVRKENERPTRQPRQTPRGRNPSGSLTWALIFTPESNFQPYA